MCVLYDSKTLDFNGVTPYVICFDELLTQTIFYMFRPNKHLQHQSKKWIDRYLIININVNLKP